MNERIRITPIRVVGPEGEQIGIIDTAEALRQARDAGLDLVEVSPNSKPPVCKIMDFGKHKYEQAKKQRKSKAAQRGGELKEVRLGRSVKIDKHDVQIRVNQARKFLLAGHKVQITQRFRGREIVHKELGLKRLAEVAASLSDISKVEAPPKWAGRQAMLILAPDRRKAEAAQSKQASTQEPTT